MFDVSLSTGTYCTSSSTYGSVTSAIKSFADAFITVNAKYTPLDGSLSEQYSRNNGTPVSARDLTWSYASALTAFSARDGHTSASWGAKGLTVPSSCFTAVSAQFNVRATTVPGGASLPTCYVLLTRIVCVIESIYLTGSVPELKNWDSSAAILMSSEDYPIWSSKYTSSKFPSFICSYQLIATVKLPADRPIEYKYIRKNGSSATWESDPNNAFTTAALGSQTLNDAWR